MASKTGNYPPKKTFGTGLKQTSRGSQMGKLSAPMPSPGGGGKNMGMGTTRVKS